MLIFGGWRQAGFLMTLRRWILKIHLYGGLICFWYLIIFAISSLHFHHHFEFMNGKQMVEGSQQIHLKLEDSKSDSALATNIQIALDIAGWYLPWETYRDNSGTFHTQIENPKTQYQIKYDRMSSTASIIRKDKGFWSVLNALHGFAGKMPNAPLFIFWNIFTYICLMVVIFSIFSGIWLWANRSEDKLIGWVTVLGIMGLSFSLMMVVYLKG